MADSCILEPSAGLMGWFITRYWTVWTLYKSMPKQIQIRLHEVCRGKWTVGRHNACLLLSAGHIVMFNQAVHFGIAQGAIRQPKQGQLPSPIILLTHLTCTQSRFSNSMGMPVPTESQPMIHAGVQICNMYVSAQQLHHETLHYFQLLRTGTKLSFSYSVGLPSEKIIMER